MDGLDRTRIETLAVGSPIRRELSEALADPTIATIAQLLCRLFVGPPNTGIDNSYVPQRFAFAKALLAGRSTLTELAIDGEPTLSRHGLGPSFTSDRLVAEDAAGEAFRFVDGTLRVPGNLLLTGLLLVAGDLHVDGVIDSGDWRSLMVLGNVYCRALVCSESWVLIDGTLNATELVLIDDFADVQVGGDLSTLGVVFGELGGSQIVVGSEDKVRHIELEDPDNHKLFLDGLVGPEDALFSWHLMRALRLGLPVWRTSLVGRSVAS